MPKPIKMTIQTTGHEKLHFVCSPLCVESLCVPIIIGCDLLQNVSFPDKPYIMWKGKQVETVRPEFNSSNCKVNAIIEINDSKSEVLSLQKFQKDREEKANMHNFKPEIGSYGDTTADQKHFLYSLVQKYRMAFSMSDDDLGKLHFYRFTLPILDESTTT